MGGLGGYFRISPVGFKAAEWRGGRGGGEVFQNSPVSLKAAEWGGGGRSESCWRL